MSKKGKPAGHGETDGVLKSLVSIGTDERSAKKLAASASLDKAIVPAYWKDGLSSHAHPIQLAKLPSFLKSFEKEFPDGEVRWDPDYYEQSQSGKASGVAIRIFFNLQEDDQGNHWSPKPTVLEEAAYEKMLKRSSYSGPRPVDAQTILHGR